MVLNASRPMPLLSCWYCGIAWYFSNSACHALSDRGGSAPVTGFHSVMESPDSVRRVAPPTSTMAKTSVATSHSHRRTTLGGWVKDLRMSSICTAVWRHIDRGPRTGNETVMSIRLRKFIGAIALLILVVVWALVAMAFAQYPVIFN